MKTFDCFMFYDEEMILDFRLNYLNDYVDKFVIVESSYSHSGEKRKLIFDIKKYSNFKDKISYMVLNKEPEDLFEIDGKEEFNRKNSKYILNALKRENFQRNYIAKGLKDASSEDMIIISDVDEIPNLEENNLDNLKNKIILFNQKFFYYKFNLIISNHNWYGSRICVKKFLKSPQWLRNQKVKKNFIGIFDRGIKVIKNGAWHFSYLMSPIKIKKKIESFAHSEYNKEEYKNLKNIESCIKNRTDLYNRKLNFEKISITSELPLYLSENEDKYANWIAK